jgi:hypothetical protein
MSTNVSEEIITKQEEMILGDGWSKVSRHENRRKQAAKISDGNES